VKREDKEAMVAELREVFAQAQVAVVADFRGLKVDQATQLRRDCQKSDVTYKVVKNTLAKLAVEGTPFAALAELFTGPSGLAVSQEDPGAPAKVLTKVQKETKKLAIRGAQLRGRDELLDAAAVAELAKMPGKDELRAQLLATFMAVPTGLARALNDVPSRFVRVLEAYRKEKDTAA